MKVKSFQELKAIRARLAEAEARAAEEAAARAAAAKRAQAEQNLFARAIGPTQPLRAHGRVVHAPAPTPPEPRQRALDEQAALRQAWSDIVDVESLLHTDEELSFRRPGVGPDVVARLRRGRWSIQGQLDLHGLRRDEARAALVEFIAVAARRGWRCVRIVHGKGLRSGQRGPVLKQTVNSLLRRFAAVVAFSSARQVDGGTGAVYVLLG